VLIALLSACSGPAENSGTSNTNAPPPQANTNSAVQPQIAQGTAPAAANPAQPTVEPTPPPPVAKSAATSNANTANTANPSAAANGHAPKLVAPAKKLDFGKQPQDKSLVRAILIKNGGRADLNIESVVPS
jgi:ABC-type Fe3+-hydroxamate transport system substrate-binding protein